MKAIAIVDQNWGLGAGGQLLTHLPGDLRYFREKTLGKTVIMGRETFEGMGGQLLPDRETVLLTRNPSYAAGCAICRSLDELLEFVKDKERDTVFACGGEMVYRLLLPYCDTVLLTKMYAAFEADRHFPNIDDRPDEFEVVWRSDEQEENGIRYQFFEYRRK